MRHPPNSFVQRLIKKIFIVFLLVIGLRLVCFVIFSNSNSIVNNEIEDEADDNRNSMYGDQENSVNTRFIGDDRSYFDHPQAFEIKMKSKLINTIARNTFTKTKVLTKTELEQGTCKAITPWGKRYHAKLSTFDLLKTVNYSTDSLGSYLIPVKTYEEIAEEADLEHLAVILVPFSHADPGYGLTVEEYYTKKVHQILNNMVEKLTKYPNLTFQWAETVFLERWFKDLNVEIKQTVRTLTERGQLEIVLGGWVMPDEASTTYIAVVDQLIEGHQWLIENVGVKPRTAWVNDPFGYSSTMPYLWKSSGMDNLLFLRINQPLKAELMRRKSLEFLWRPYWARSGTSDVLASLMPYVNYWVSDVCGPVQQICDQFNFLHIGERENIVEINEDNVAMLAEKLQEQFRVTGNLYKYKTLYVGLGEDVSYTHSRHWENMYTNYEKLITYINSQKHWKMKVKFGTMSEYFDTIRKEEARMVQSNRLSKSLSFPILSGDFFPYTDRNSEFWTGYFTTRPLNKRFAREIEALLRAADIFHVVVYSLFKNYGVAYTGYRGVAENLRKARRELGIFQHHDGITGTSVYHVVRDFEQRLLLSSKCVHAGFKTTLISILSRGKVSDPKLLQEETVKPEARQMSRKIVIDTSKQTKIILVNSLSIRRKETISIFVNHRKIAIETAQKNSVNFQTTIPKLEKQSTYFEVSFVVDLPALSIETYTISPTDSIVSRKEANERMLGEESVFIENMFMKVEFDSSNGMIKRIHHRDGTISNISNEFFAYQSGASGAYIFGPNGPAIAFTSGQKMISVTNGQVVSEVKVTWPGFYHSVKLYNNSDIQGHGVYIHVEVDMAAINMQEMEVILRFQTDVKNGNNFFTDQNGYQLIGRETRPGEKIESNYYPVSTMLVLEDGRKRITLHCKQPHGGASLKEGQFEVMLDRHTNRDDKRGLGQGVTDNVKVNSDFVLHIEPKRVFGGIKEPRYSYPTQDATIINDVIQNNIFIYSVVEPDINILEYVHPVNNLGIPCGIHIVGLRNLVTNDLTYNGTSLVLHRRPSQCGFWQHNKVCSKQHAKLTMKSLFPKLKANLYETSLSLLHDKRLLSLDSDISPEPMELRTFRIKL